MYFKVKEEVSSVQMDGRGKPELEIGSSLQVVA